MGSETTGHGQFWMVWNVGGRAPTHAHTSLEAANNEAMRLARLAPGQTFVVLEALHGFRMPVPPPPPVDKVPLAEIDHLPF